MWYGHIPSELPPMSSLHGSALGTMTVTCVYIYMYKQTNKQTNKQTVIVASCYMCIYVYYPEGLMTYM